MLRPICTRDDRDNWNKQKNYTGKQGVFMAELRSGKGEKYYSVQT